MLLRFASASLGALLLFAACGGDGSDYPDDREDDAYDLEAMALEDGDLPQGVEQRQAQSFDNAEWAEAFPNADEDQLEVRKNQLDAQGRVKGFVAIFTWDAPIEHLGRPYQYTSHSTLFVDTSKAIDSMTKFCDLPIDGTNPLKELRVPRMADGSVGFQVSEKLENFGESIDTVVCFRTGRIVHAVVQSGLEGTADTGLSVRLARRMLAHVDDAFAQDAADSDDDDEGDPTPGS
ncbi:MAG: hypothetical protein ACR2HN_05500 [Tepidiformaceae bacterium]